MDRSVAVRQLPEPYAVAIRLRDQGYSEHVIAVAIEVEDGQVPTFMQIADKKLANLLGHDREPESTAVTTFRRQTKGPSASAGAAKKNDRGGSS